MSIKAAFAARAVIWSLDWPGECQMFWILDTSHFASSDLFSTVEVPFDSQISVEKHVKASNYYSNKKLMSEDCTFSRGTTIYKCTWEMRSLRNNSFKI